MFSSSSIGNPFSYNNETLFTDSSKIEENPNNNSSQEDRPPLPFHFPSPFLDTGDAPHLAHLLPQIDHNQTTIINPETTSSSNCRHPRKGNGSTGGATTNPHPQPNSRRRTGKKDRHSKICTAQGLRDRRMRLSVQIARKFFDLQDLLGFDKASKTIEWLFSKSKSAIKEVTRNLPRVKQSSSVSTKSSNTKGVMIQDQESVHKVDKGKGIEVSVGVPIEEKNGKSWKNLSYDPHHAKESRDKARARARERTREKMIIRGLEKPIGTYDHHANPNSLEHQFPSEGIIESFLGTASANSSTARSIFGFQNNPAVSDGEDSNNNFLGINENWEMENARINSDYGALTNMVPMTANLEEQNPNPIADSSVYFQSQLISGNQFYCRWQ